MGFKKKEDIPIGKHRWLTIVSPDDPNGIEILLEPSDHPAVRLFKEAIVKDNIPYKSFTVKNIYEKYEQPLRNKVHFVTKPTEMDTVIVAIFNDTCGNLIQLIQHK